jgi:hypothetical protein
MPDYRQLSTDASTIELGQLNASQDHSGHLDGKSISPGISELGSWPVERLTSGLALRFAKVGECRRGLVTCCCLSRRLIVHRRRSGLLRRRLPLGFESHGRGLTRSDVVAPSAHPADVACRVRHTDLETVPAEYQAVRCLVASDGGQRLTRPECDAGPVNPEQLARARDMAMNLAREGRTSELAEFLDHGFDVDAQDSEGNSLLMLAAYHGRADTVALLLARGADPDLRNHRDQTPIAGALFKGEDAIVAQLKDADADLDAGTPSAHDAARMFGRAL